MDWLLYLVGKGQMYRVSQNKKKWVLPYWAFADPTKNCHCTSTDVAFIRGGLDCKQKSADASKLKGCWTFFPMNHSSLRAVYVVKSVLENQKSLEWLKVISASCCVGPWKVIQ